MPLTITDIIVVVSLIYCFYKGWSKGFFHTLMGPLAFIIATVASIVYYKKTDDILMSLGIGIVGPFILMLIFFIVSKIIKLNQKEEFSPSSQSRFWGGFLHMTWSGAWILLTLVCLAMIPNVPFLKDFKQDIVRSKSFSLVNALTGGYLSDQTRGLETLQDVFKDPEKFKAVVESNEYKALMQDKNMQALLSDEQTLQEFAQPKGMTQKDILKFMANPKFKQILEDKETVKKIFDLNKKLGENSSAK